MAADAKYPDGQPICVGDNVFLDGIHIAIVEKIFRPGSQEAKNFDCEKTGGLLLNAQEYGLIVSAFGSSDVTEKTVGPRRAS